MIPTHSGHTVFRATNRWHEDRKHLKRPEEEISTRRKRNKEVIGVDISQTMIKEEVPCAFF
jgi:hypothetical protein